MLISEILKNKGASVHSLDPGETLAQAAETLNARRIGALVVKDADEVVGIFSERDLVRAVSERGCEALADPVARHMTREVVSARPEDSTDTLLARMTDRRVRHLPICRRGELVGIVSIGDLVKAKVAEAEAKSEALLSYITAA